MSRRILPTALLLALPLSAAAATGDVSLEMGTGAVLREDGRQPALSAQMGFRFGATDRSEVRLGVDYGRFLPSDRWESQTTFTGVALGTYFTPYPGRLQPILGVHVGMVEVDESWRMDLGLQAGVLAGVHPGAQAYFTLDPGVWMADADPELWVKAGAGFRFRLGL